MVDLMVYRIEIILSYFMFYFNYIVFDLRIVITYTNNRLNTGNEEKTLNIFIKKENIGFCRICHIK